MSRKFAFGFRFTTFFILFPSGSILDDIEMYEQQSPFELSDYVGLSYFLNNFLFKAIQDNVFGRFALGGDFMVHLFLQFLHTHAHRSPSCNVSPIVCVDAHTTVVFVSAWLS